MIERRSLPPVNLTQDDLVKHLQGDSAQKHIEQSLKIEQIGELHRVFDDKFRENMIQPDIDQLFHTIEERNDWNKVEKYFNDFTVIAYQELFDVDTGFLKKEIEKAINFKDAHRVASLKQKFGEKEFHSAIFKAFLGKMFLNSAFPFVKEKAEHDEEQLINTVNQKLSDYQDKIDIAECHRLAHKCIEYGSQLSKDFMKLEWQNREENKQPTIVSYLEKLKRILSEAQNYILPTQLQECEELVTNIQRFEPDYPWNTFDQKVANAFHTVMKKEFEFHKAHTDKAYHKNIAKHNLLEEVKQLRRDLKDEGKKEFTEYISDIDDLLKGEINEREVIRLKLLILSQAFSLTKEEIEAHKKALSSNKQDKDVQAKITKLESFDTFLSEKQREINKKLEQPTLLVREDIHKIIRGVADKNKDIQEAGIPHSFWLFRILDKLGFHIKTSTEKIFDNAENRAIFGAKPTY